MKKLKIAALLIACVMLMCCCRDENQDTIKREETILNSVEAVEKLYCTVFVAEVPSIKTKSGVFRDESIVIIYRITIKSGIDLHGFSLDNITVSGDSVSLELPSPEILSIRCNPMETRCFHGSESFSEREITSLYKEAIADAKSKAEDGDILGKASAQAENFFVSLLSSMGFRKITITFNN